MLYCTSPQLKYSRSLWLCFHINFHYSGCFSVLKSHNFNAWTFLTNLRYNQTKAGLRSGQQRLSLRDLTRADGERHPRAQVHRGRTVQRQSVRNQRHVCEIRGWEGQWSNMVVHWLPLIWFPINYYCRIARMYASVFAFLGEALHTWRVWKCHKTATSSTSLPHCYLHKA